MHSLARADRLKTDIAPWLYLQPWGVGFRERDVRAQVIDVLPDRYLHPQGTGPARQGTGQARQGTGVGAFHAIMVEADSDILSLIYTPGRQNLEAVA